MATELRILFLADSHLGFDLPVKPRVDRRRRGHDFLANYLKALELATAGGVDLVVHGGDVFDRPRVVPSLAYQAFQPLVRIAERGVPVFIVPGNHERSALPHPRFLVHPLIHVFDRPRTFMLDIRGMRIALTGFPYERRNVRTRFRELLALGGWETATADMRVLCMHHCVEGATVGPGNFTFTTGADVIRCADLPESFGVVLSGHIHRRQALITDLRRRALPSPVLYPGSIERTSVAEIDEEKGFMMVRIAADQNGGTATWEFHDLPARPMIVQDLPLYGDDAARTQAALVALIRCAPQDAVLRIRIAQPADQTAHVLTAANLRRLAPPSMNVELVFRTPFARV